MEQKSPSQIYREAKEQGNLEDMKATIGYLMAAYAMEKDVDKLGSLCITLLLAMSKSATIKVGDFLEGDRDAIPEESAEALSESIHRLFDEPEEDAGFGVEAEDQPFYIN